MSDITFERASWQMRLPENWEIQESEDCLSFFDPDGVGELQISSYECEAEVEDADLREFAGEQVAQGAQLADVRCGDFNGYHATFTTGDEHLRYWWIRHRHTFLFATYDCAPEEQGREDAEVDRVLSTLAPSPR